MAETLAVPTPQPRRALHFEWVIPTLIRPRQAFTEIAAQSRSVWLAPILILTVAALMHTLLSGSISQAAAANGNVTLPPGFEYYTPEQQAQFQQAMSGMQSPVFVYVIPSIVTLIVVWLGWLILGGLLHLILTLMGGRSSTLITMNIVAWASLPLAVRSLVQFMFMVITHQLVSGQGLAGFVPANSGRLLLLVRLFMGLIDIYVIWQIVLLVVGVRTSSALSRPRAWLSVLLAFGVLILLQVLIGFGQSLLSGLSIMQPFMY
jgi:hypothetical protein